MVSWSYVTNWRLESQLPVKWWSGSLWQQAAEAHLDFQLGESQDKTGNDIQDNKRENSKSEIREESESDDMSDFGFTMWYTWYWGDNPRGLTSKEAMTQLNCTHNNIPT